jgi:hypothetical protein
MTWHTSIGDRVLEGVEAEFYLTAMQYAIEYLKSLEEVADELDVETGDRIFDIANFDQKVVLLHACLSAFLDPNVEMPKLSNVLEAAAYFPFAVLRTEIVIEIESDQIGEFDDDETYRYFNRQVVWKAFEEYVRPIWERANEEDEQERTFDLRSTNVDLWDQALEGLTERFFWDRDWTLTSQNPQLLDGIETSLAEITGLTDYFTNRLPTVTAAQASISFTAIKNWQLNSSS